MICNGDGLNERVVVKIRLPAALGAETSALLIIVTLMQDIIMTAVINRPNPLDESVVSLRAIGVDVCVVENEVCKAEFGLSFTFTSF